MTTAWRWLLRACALATVLPLVLVRFFPIIDLPEHVTVVASLRHWFDPAWDVREHFVVAWGASQYLLFHALGAALAFLPVDAETATRALLVAAGLAYPYSARALLRALGRDERLALFACAAFWSRPLIYGFLPYVASPPVVLWGLALVVEQARAPTPRRAIALGAITLALFYLHVHAFLLFLGAAAGLLIALRARRLTSNLVWPLPGCAAAAAWALHGEIALGHAASLRDPGQVWWSPRASLAKDFPLWAHDVWSSHVDEWSTVAFWSLLAVLALQTARRERPRLVLFVPLACALALYVALPFQIGGAGMVNVRLALFFALLAPLTLRPSEGWAGRLPLAGAAVVAFVVAANAFVHARAAATNEAGDFDRLLAATRPGGRLVSLVFHASSDEVDLPVWVHMGSYHRARKGGVSDASFAELGHWPVVYRADAAPPPKPHPFWEFDPCVYRNEIDGAYYDYVLTRGDVDPFRDAPPGPRWRVAAREKEWTLYEKVPGATNPRWSVADRGPCESRRSLEALAASLHAPSLHDGVLGHERRADAQ